MNMIGCRRNLKCLIIFITISLVLVAFYTILASFLTKQMFAMDLHQDDFDEEIKGHIDSQKGQACISPDLDPNNPDLIKFFFDFPKPNCKKNNDWVYVINGTFYVSKNAVMENGDITCDYIPIVRAGDFAVEEGSIIAKIENGTKIVSDAFQVKCNSTEGRSFKNVYLSVQHKEELLSRSAKIPKAKTGLGIDVIWFGFDSVSRMTFMRKMPKSYNYIKNVLKSSILEGYNIVGDGTPQALLPILTGKTEPELPEARRGHKGAEPVDKHPWIWNDFEKQGYTTQHGEDQPSIGTFTYRMMGFKDQPVDHYLRPFYLVYESKYSSQNKAYCLGSLGTGTVMMNAQRDFLMAYEKNRKFSFVFVNVYSHGGNNPLNIVDEDLAEYLKSIFENGFLDNAMLIIMSDHGARFKSVRETVQGKSEERNPFFSIRLPDWMHSKYPHVTENFKINSHRLVTPFDIHATFKDILDFKNIKIGNISNRGISLFQEIPKERTCTHAQIEPHWCNCLKWETVPNTNTFVQQAAQTLLFSLNNYTIGHLNKCAKLTLVSVTYSVVYKPNEHVLKFKQTADKDGFVADMTDNTKTDAVLYQIRIRTAPGNGHFEATIRHILKSDKYVVNPREISRINAYGKDANCITENYPHLRQICFCKNSSMND